jgi:hypothetical protein
MIIRAYQVVSRALSLAASSLLLCAGAPAHAQSNLDAGKTPAQIFASTCNACHRSPREIKKTTAAFMREHYTTGPREAATMAAYLASVGSDPDAVKQRRAPVLGAGQAPAPETATARAPANGEQPEAAAGAPQAADKDKPEVKRLRRPADSIELGSAGTEPGAGDGAASPAPPPPPARASSRMEIEE